MRPEGKESCGNIYAKGFLKWVNKLIICKGVSFISRIKYT